MSQYKPHGSAFYPGTTRYGGSAANAKRREAARKAFFTFEKGPSSSSRSNTFNGPNLVNSYTIDSSNIIRQEPVVPQLTSQAKKIYSWIQENSYSQQETFQLTKRTTLKKHRFNPMSYRAPIVQTHAKITPTPIRTAPQIQPQLNNISTKLSFSPPKLIKEIPKVLPVIEPPKSIKFKPAKYHGPVNEVPSIPCKARIFAPAEDLTVKIEPIKIPEKVEVALPKLTPIVEEKKKEEPKSPPASTVIAPPSSAPLFPSITPKAPSTPQFTFSSPINSGSSPVVDVGKNMSATAKTPSLAPISQPKAPTVSPSTTPLILTSGKPNNAPPTGPATSTPPPKNPVPQTQPQLNNMGSKFTFSSPKLTKEIPKTLPVIEPPKSIKFKPAKYHGPVNEVPSIPCKARIFAPAEDLTVKIEPIKIPEKVEVALPKLTPIVEEKKKEEPKSPPASTVIAPPSSAPLFPSITPNATSPQFSFPSTVNSGSSPVVDVEMDIDADMDAPLSAVLSQPSNLTAPSTAVPSIPTPGQPNCVAPAGPVPTTPVVAQAAVAPSIDRTVPVVSQPLFMPQPSFSTPAFAPRIPPVTGLSLPNGSNPFQPTSVRGRKILRPTRRLHR